MSEKTEVLACIRELHEVLLRHDADLHYTIDDDGIHLTMRDKEVAVFWGRAGLAETKLALTEQGEKGE